MGDEFKHGGKGRAEGRAEERGEGRDLEALAVLLDSKFVGPFGIRLGWDGLIGLIPVIGDVATSVASAYIIGRSAMLGAKPVILIRMLLNLFIDNAISAVPLLGWAGDFAWKANLRNIALLRAHRLEPEQTSRRSTLLLLVLVGCLIFFAILLAAIAGWVGWMTLRALIHLF